ncbi:MAG: preprotein translocase subunit SecG [Deltaproteobacteria bacterium]|nr:MAG: preprotein translocase subunit SecG [Deltaproteobacteria bacterium]
MNYILLTIHIVGCLSLIGIVLIQGGKGAEVGAAFGAGSSNTIFGASGGQSFLGKLTTGVAVIFMLTSLSLAVFWGQAGSSSVMPDQVAPVSAPVAAPIAAPTATPAATPGQSIPPAAPAGDTK